MNGKVPKNFHGVKGKSGRKPLPFTILKRRLVEDKAEEAEASFAFLVAVRDNELEPIEIRVAAAKEILNRVLGKPTESVKMDTTIHGAIPVQAVDYQQSIQVLRPDDANEQ